MVKGILRKLSILYFETVPFRKGKERFIRYALRKGILNKPFIFRFDRGLKMKLDISDWVNFQIFLKQGYEKPESMVWKELCSRSHTIIDIGANIGYYSLIASRHTSGKIYSFEPVTETQGKFRANIELNKFSNIYPVQKIISDKAGRIRIYFDDATNTGTASLVKESSEKTAFEEVESTTLDQFAADNALGKIDLVKIDVEGSEFLVLRGMEKTLTDSRPFLMVEVLEETLAKFGFGIIDIYNYLDAKGYQAYDISGKLIIKKISTPIEKIGLILFAHKEATLPPSIQIIN